MQIFTLGRSGMSLFLFAFILFSGTHSYGQENCPEVTDQNPGTSGNQQFFCDSIEAELNNLLVEGDDVAYYATAESDEALEPTTLLIGGTTYYVGTSTENCGIPVTVTVYNQPQILGVEENSLNRQATTKQSLGTLGICVADIDNPGVYVSDFRTSAPANSVRWYYSTAANAEPQPIADPENTELQHNTYYYVERVYEDFENDANNCATNRSRTLVLFTEEAAPEGEPLQFFCEANSPVLADIEVSGDEHRYYATSTSQVEISQNTLLEDGKTYYISSVGVTCESEERFAVTVQFENVAGDDNIGQEFCRNEFPAEVNEAAVENFFFSLLSDDAAPGGTFSGIAETTADFNSSGTFPITTTYTVDNGDCEDTAEFSVTILGAPDAGDDNSINYCHSQVQAALDGGETFEGLFEDLLEPGITGGSFESIPEYDGPRTYTSLYTIVSDNGCEDSAEISITVEEDPGLEIDSPLEFCQSEIESILRLALQNPDEAEALLRERLGDIPTNGSFPDNSLAAIGFAYLGAVETGDFPFEASTTYTVENEGGCEASSVVELIVYESPYAGEDRIETLSEEDDDPIDLFEVLTGENPETDTPDEGGTWTDESGNVTNSFFDPNTESEGVFTYTVSAGNCEDSATVTIRFEVDQVECPEVTNPEQSFCPGDDSTVADLLPAGATWYATADDSEILDANTPLIDGEDYFAGNANGTCDTRGMVTVNFDSQIAGSDNSDVICNVGLDDSIDDEGQVRNLFLNLLDEGVSRNGSFRPTISQIINRYESGDQIGDFTTTYTVSAGDCQDSAELTLTVVEPTEADVAEIDGFTICSNEGTLNLFDHLSLDPETGSFENEDGIIVNGNLDISTTRVSTITYTVNEENAFCITGSDFTTFDVEVIQGPDLGEDVALEYCISEIEEMNEAEALAIFNSLVPDDVDQDGEFSTPISTLITQFLNNPIGTFETTYTVTEGDCQPSIDLSITINDETDAEAGEFEDLAFCTTDEDQDLYTFLSADATRGGTFSIDGEELENGTFRPSALGVDTYTVTYTVDESIDCVEGEESVSFEIEVTEGPDLGENVALEYCISEIEEMSEAEALAIFNSLVPDDVDQDGEFSTPISTLITQFLNNPIGTFETTYTVTEGGCQASIDLSVTINDETDAEAGEFEDLTFCTTDEDQDLNEFLSSDATRGGTFSIDGEELENGTFSPSALAVDTYTITYTVDESVECVEGEDYASFDVTVVEGEFAGNDNSEEICNAEIAALLPNVSNVRDLFLDLLDEGVSREGTFNPSIQSLADRYNSGDQIGTFTTEYTVSNGVCEDSVELSIIVVDTTEPGGDIAFSFCSTEGPQNLYDLLSEEGVSTDGSFDDLEDGIFNPSENEADEYVFEYTTTSAGVCGETVYTVTVTVNEAEAPTVADQTFCVSQEATVADLQATGENIQWYTDEELTTAAEDTDALVEGNYYATQTTEEGCVSDATMITVTFEETPEAPVVADLTFCVVEGATVAELQATGENIQWYSDAALSAPLDQTTVLTAGDYYATQTTAGGCESESAMITVTLEDAPAPTLVSGGNEFCGFDRPTIAELENNIVEDGTITWYSAAQGGETYSTSELLTEGTTYYASLTNGAEACESSQRLAITVDLGACPIEIPEAFSPNGDGINDTFEIEYIADEYPNFRIEIYNRWGNKVFEGNSSRPDWDGVSTESSLGNDVLPVGVYFYILDYNDGQTSPSQGRLYLSR